MSLTSTDAYRTNSFAVDTDGKLITVAGAASSVTDSTTTITTSGTAVQLTATATPCKAVVVDPYETNAGVVVWGASTVVAAAATRRGARVQGPTTIQINDASKIYVDSTISGDKVAWVVLK